MGGVAGDRWGYRERGTACASLLCWLGRLLGCTAHPAHPQTPSPTTAHPTLQSLNPTITQVRERLGLELSRAGNGMQQLKPPGAAAAGSSSSNGAPLSRASEVAMQAEAAARDVNVSRRQADAQAWIAAYRSRSRGNKKAAAAAAASHPAGAGMDTQQLEEVGWAVGWLRGAGGRCSRYLYLPGPCMPLH